MRISHPARATGKSAATGTGLMWVVVVAVLAFLTVVAAAPADAATNGTEAPEGTSRASLSFVDALAAVLANVFG